MLDISSMASEALLGSEYIYTHSPYSVGISVLRMSVGRSQSDSVSLQKRWELPGMHIQCIYFLSIHSPERRPCQKAAVFARSNPAGLAKLFVANCTCTNAFRVTHG